MHTKPKIFVAQQGKKTKKPQKPKTTPTREIQQQSLMFFNKKHVSREVIYNLKV